MNTPDELKDVESRLRSLRPVGGVEQDQVMFEAGRAAGARGVRVWRGVAGVLGLVLVCAVTLPVTMRGPERMVGQERGGSATTARELGHAEPPPRRISDLPQPPAGNGLAYLELRRRVLDEGVEVLRSPAGGPSDGEPSRPLDYDRILQLLEKTL